MKRLVLLLFSALFVCGCQAKKTEEQSTPTPAPYFDSAVESDLFTSLDDALYDKNLGRSYYTIELQDILIGKEFGSEILWPDITRVSGKILYMQHDIGTPLILTLTESQKDFLVENDCHGKAILYKVTDVKNSRFFTVDYSIDDSDPFSSEFWIDDIDTLVIYGVCTAIFPDGPKS